MLTRDFTRRPFASSLWGDMQRLQEEMNTLFSRAAQPRTAAFPAVNVWTGPESVVVTCELPGVGPDDLDISVVGETLTIRGARTPEQLGEGSTYHRRERGHGRFTRVLQLPFRVEPDEVNAAFKNGVLSITLPHAQADRPKKIQVTTA